MNLQFYRKNNIRISKLTTNNYSTSFSMGVRILRKEYRAPIHAIYGFVRYADEIVDTFFDYPQEELLKEFREETYKAIQRKISTNPIIDSFQWVVNEYKIEKVHIDTFLNSMEMDLTMKDYDNSYIKEYIDGSAEVVGLMCLRVFYQNDDETYERLKIPARKLGEAFQKVNFLRDMKSDFLERGRVYFPNIIGKTIDEKSKKEIEENIESDFAEAFEGIKALHKDVRLGVYLAYLYYLELFKLIQKVGPEELMKKRYRVSNPVKLWILIKAYIRNQFDLFKPWKSVNSLILSSS